MTGNLGADPEIALVQDDKLMVTFSLAFRCPRKKTGWIKVVCWNRLAEVAERYFHKGAKIGVIGALEQQRWENEAGQPRSGFQVTAQSLEFIKTDGRGFGEGESPEELPF